MVKILAAAKHSFFACKLSPTPVYPLKQRFGIISAVFCFAFEPVYPAFTTAFPWLFCLVKALVKPAQITGSADFAALEFYKAMLKKRE